MITRRQMTSGIKHSLTSFLWIGLSVQLRRFSVRSRMWTLLAIFTLALIAVGATAVLGQRHIGQTTTSFLSMELVSLNRISELQMLMSELRHHEKDMLINFENSEDAEKAKKSWLKTFDQFLRTATLLQSSLPSDESKKVLSEALQHLESFKAGFLPISKKLENNLLSSGRSAVALMEPLLPEFSAAQGKLVVLSNEIHQVAKVAEVNLSRTTDAVITTVISITVGVLIISLPFTFLNLSSISGPLRNADEIARRIASGDLRTSLPSISGHDEISNLLSSLAVMKNNLTDLVREIRVSASNIAEATSEIAAGNLDLSNRTQMTSSSLQELSSSMSTLAETVSEGSNAAKEADQIAARTAETATIGGESVQAAGVAMSDIANGSNKIADIIGVINNLSFQTNILAINAAVEAAHAGESGRGFSVVAAEVRALASGSSKAAREIAALVQENVKDVSTGVIQVGTAGETIAGIVTSMNHVAAVVTEMSNAASEQSKRIADAAITVATLDQMTQQNAALVEESAAAASSLKDQADKLLAIVDSFQLQNDITYPPKLLEN